MHNILIYAQISDIVTILDKKYYNYLYVRTFTSIEKVYTRIKTMKK